MNTNRLVRLIAVGVVVLLVISVGAYFWFRPNGTSTISVPVGDDMATQIKKGTTIYTVENVPAFVLNGTRPFTTDFSATVKVLNALNTRTIRVEILSPTAFEQQPGYMGYLYLCTPLSEKAEKFADGTVGYNGTGYPQIIAGRSYDVAGVLQPGWQDYPLVYIPTAGEFQQNADDSINNQMLFAAARSFAEQAAAAGNHHMTRQPTITVSSNQVQAGKVEALMTIEAMDALNSGPTDAQPIIAGELQYLQDHGAELSVAGKKTVEDDIAYWRGTIASAMNVPSDTSYMIKVVGDVDVAGNIDASSLQVYVDNGVKGSNFIPEAQFFEGIRSLRVTVAQAYANAASIASGASAKISMMEKTNVTSSGDYNAPSTQYDAAPFMWDVVQNTLRSSGTAVLHVNDVDNSGDMLRWCSGSPLLAVQQWSNRDKVPLATVTAKDLTLLVPPAGMQYITSDSLVRWYVPEEKAFVTAPSQLLVSSPQKTLDGTTITITEHALASGSKAQSLTVPVPSGMWQIVVAYGSGSMNNGFVLVEASQANAAMNAPGSLWFLRMNGGKARWIRCGDLCGFGGSLFAAINPSFARIGSLLYFVHGHGKIACIDTAAPSPSITWPEKINALLDDIYQKGGTDPAAPIPADLASDNGLLIIEYPDVNWNRVYYAVDGSGTVLGSLRADKTSVTSFDAKGKRGSSLPFKNASDNISLPSVDLFE